MIIPPKLAAIDLDGTLLSSVTHSVSAVNAAAVRNAVQRGMTITLASGRQFATIKAFARQLNLPLESPIIAFNGALIRTQGGDTWFHQPLPAAASSTIVHFCMDHGCHLNYYLNDELYVQKDTAWGRIYQERTGTVPHIVGDLTRFDGRQPTKLLLIDTRETTDRLLMQFQSDFGTSLYITKTEDEYLEFMDAGVNKGAALAQIAARLDFDASECAAFGDSYNDISMVEWAGNGVAMENARLELKAVAKVIAPAADEDGVACVLNEWLGGD